MRVRKHRSNDFPRLNCHSVITIMAFHLRCFLHFIIVADIIFFVAVLRQYTVAHHGLHFRLIFLPVYIIPPNAKPFIRDDAIAGAQHLNCLYEDGTELNPRKQIKRHQSGLILKFPKKYIFRLLRSHRGEHKLPACLRVGCDCRHPKRCL